MILFSECFGDIIGGELLFTIAKEKRLLDLAHCNEFAMLQLKTADSTKLIP